VNVAIGNAEPTCGRDAACGEIVTGIRGAGSLRQDLPAQYVFGSSAKRYDDRRVLTQLVSGPPLAPAYQRRPLIWKSIVDRCDDGSDG
jgi:hypothetical protein